MKYLPYGENLVKIDPAEDRLLLVKFLPDRYRGGAWGPKLEKNTQFLNINAPRWRIDWALFTKCSAFVGSFIPVRC